MSRRKFFRQLFAKKYWENSGNKNAVTTSKTLTEYAKRICRTIASNNCQTLRLKT